MPENRERRSDRNVGRLVDVAPDAECGPIPYTGSGARAISLRVDLTHLVVSRGDVIDRLSLPCAPKVVVGVSSEIAPGATHLFEEPGALEHVARLAREWFVGHLDGPSRSPAR